jgi:hypothetical protein
MKQLRNVGHRSKKIKTSGDRMTAHQALEHQEHATHAAHTGGNRPALLVAILAALLAICEQRAKHAEIRLEESSIGATDSWGQYQAKSTRAMISRDLADVFAAGPADDREQKILQRLRDDADHYEHGKDGKDAIAKHAHELEEERDRAIEETHAYDNAAACLELGIVLATASAITQSNRLLLLALAVGILGVCLGVLGYVSPSLAAL